MGGWLQIRKENSLVANTHLSGSRVVIGRSPDCDVILASDSVSRQHAELVAHGDNWSVRDLGSRNGTGVNGVRVNGERPLQPGDVLQIDVFEMLYRSEHSALSRPPQVRPKTAVTMMDAAAYGPVRTLHELAPPKIDASHLSKLMAFSGELLSEAALEQRQAQLAALVGDANLVDVSRRTLDSAVLSRAADAARASFQDQPLVRAGLLFTIADTMSRLGLFQSAAPIMEESVEIRRRLLGDTHPATLDAEAKFAAILADVGSLQRAEDLLRDVLVRQRRRGLEGELAAVDAMNDLALVLRRRGRFTEAERLCKDVIEAHERLHGPDDPRTLSAVSNLGLFLMGRGMHRESEECFRRAVDGFTKLYGEHHADVYIAMANLGVALRNQNKLEDAEAITRKAYNGRRALQGDDHPDTLRTLSNLGHVLQVMGRYDEAIDILRHAADRRRQILGDEHHEALESMRDLGLALRRVGRHAQAEPVLRQTRQAYDRTLGPGSPDSAICRFELAHALMALERYPEAEIELLAVEKALGPGHDSGRKGPGDALIELYEAWDKAHPGQGYDAKAKARRDKLPPDAAAPADSPSPPAK